MCKHEILLYFPLVAVVDLDSAICVVASSNSVNDFSSSVRVYVLGLQM